MPPILVGCAALLLAPQPAAETPRATANRLNATYRKAMLAENLEFFDKNVAFDFYRTGIDGKKRFKPELMDQLIVSFADTELKKFDVSLVSVKSVKGGLLLVNDLKMEAIWTREEVASTVRTSSRHEVFVANIGGKWYFQRTRVLKEVQTIQPPKASAPKR